MNTLKLVQEIAKLVRVNLPLEPALHELASKTAQPLRQAADDLADRLAQGTPLRDALAHCGTPAANMLASAVDIGSAAGRLDVSLESWAKYILARHSHRTQLANVMVYPVAIMLIAVGSLVFCVYTLIPHYDEAFGLLTDFRPDWLEWLSWTRQYLWLLVTVLVLAMILPVSIVIFRRWRNDRWGVPKDRALRFYLQAHTARLASLAMTTGQPISEVRTSLGRALRSGPALPDLPTTELIGRETSAILAAVHTNSIPSTDAQTLLQTLATQLQLTGDYASQREARWVPMLVSLTVGVVVGISYVILIYLPWVILFCYISSPTLS